MRFILPLVGLCLFGSLRAENLEPPKAAVQPVILNSTADFGQVIKGSAIDEGEALHGEPIHRLGTSLESGYKVGEKLEIRAGVGGIFWYVFPPLPGSPHTILIRFVPGLSDASLKLSLGGNRESAPGSLKFGFFRYKYNSDASNLGEYLFRSNTYPGVIYTGDWSLMNSASYPVLGAQFQWKQFDGGLTHDLIFATEHSSYPVGSLSPGYVINYKSPTGAFEVGAGAQWQHLIPIKPSQLTPASDQSTWVMFNDFPALQADSIQTVYPGENSQTTISIPAKSAGPIEGLAIDIKDRKDASGSKPYSEKLFQNKQNPNDLVTKDDPKYIATPTAYQESDVYRYDRSEERISFRGIKLMAKMAVDVSRLFSWEKTRGNNLRFFAEAAILGVQNQKFYYEDITQRIPVMFGTSLPSFGLLDQLVLQGEWYGSAFPESQEQFYKNQVPTWTLPQLLGSAVYRPSLYHKDDWKWSVNLRREVMPGLRFYTQVASDHMRTNTFLNFPSNSPIVNNPREWYYLIRLEYGI